MKKIILTFILSLGTFFFSSTAQSQPADSPLQRYLVPANITQMEWQLQILRETFMRNEIFRLIQQIKEERETYYSYWMIDFNHEKEKIQIDIGINTPLFEKLSLAKKKEMFFKSFSKLKEYVKGAFPEFEEERDLLVHFISLNAPEVIIAIYEWGKLQMIDHDY